MKPALFVLLAVAAANAQKPDPSITFEVASVKMPPPRVLAGPTRMGCTGGPGTADPGRFSCANAAMPELLRLAFDLQSYQMTKLAGVFESHSTRVGETYQFGFDIEARVPRGASREAFRTMLQNLLIDRFKLAYHFERKESDAYDLLIAKNGPKLKEAAPQLASSTDQATTRSSSPARRAYGPNGCPADSGGQTGTVSLLVSFGAGTCAGGKGAPIGELAKYLGREVGHPVTDATGLTGVYDISLGFTRDLLGATEAPDMPGLPAISSASLLVALQEQLGLRLEKTNKGSIDLFVIDHIEKVPTDN
jgi:uncharacterized protein (TIGR03435 family)